MYMHVCSHIIFAYQELALRVALGMVSLVIHGLSKLFVCSWLLYNIHVCIPVRACVSAIYECMCMHMFAQSSVQHFHTYAPWSVY